MSILSKKAYHDEGNKKRRASTKQLIIDFLSAPDNAHRSFTYEEIAMCVAEFRGDTRKTQPRCSELESAGILQIVGERDRKSLYRYVTGSIPCPKPSGTEIWKRAIRQYVPQTTYDKIIKEREALRKFA